MRRGAALVVVLYALALSSALAVGGAYVARQLASSARIAQRGAELEPLVERALVSAVADWDTAARTAQSIGSVVQLMTTGSPSGTRAWLTRLTENTFWLVAEASADAKPLLYRRLGLLLDTADGTATPVPLRAWSELP